MGVGENYGEEEGKKKETAAVRGLKEGKGRWSRAGRENRRKERRWDSM